MQHMTDDQRQVIRNWASALRSGEFQQGKGLLRHGGKYCCLGVLCELHRRETGGPKWTWDSLYGRESYLDERYGLPEAVREWSGLPDSNCPLPSQLCSAIGMNDSGATFAEIADAIEKDYLS